MCVVFGFQFVCSLFFSSSPFKGNNKIGYAFFSFFQPVLGVVVAAFIKFLIKHELPYRRLTAGDLTDSVERTHGVCVIYF